MGLLDSQASTRKISDYELCATFEPVFLLLGLVVLFFFGYHSIGCLSETPSSTLLVFYSLIESNNWISINRVVS